MGQIVPNGRRWANVTALVAGLFLINGETEVVS